MTAEYDTYSVELDGDEKSVHYNGYVHHAGCGDRGREWRAVEFSWAYAPIAATIAAGKTMRDACDAITEAGDRWKHYTRDLDEHEAESYRADARLLPLEDVTADTPCGRYWCPF